jgi:hypothetical protein
MKMTRKLVCVKALLVALVLTCLAAGTASAQARYTSKVTLPFEVRWGKTMLPAGEYRFQVLAGGGFLTAINAVGGKASALAVPIAVDEVAFSAADSLLLTKDGGQWHVREIRLPSQGRALTYEPRNPHGSKKVEHAQSEMVVLIRTGE